MSNTPPGRSTGGNPAAGDGEQVDVVNARGAQRTGRQIWVLAISLGLIVVLMLGYVALHSRHMQTINHPAGRDLNAADVSTFKTPPPSARQAPPGETSTSGNSAQ